MRYSIDYNIKLENGTEISLEVRQKQVRQNVIEKYVQCRKEMNMTQEDVANWLGIARTNITRFENGTYNPTLDFLVKVAESMGKEVHICLKDKE